MWPEIKTVSNILSGGYMSVVVVDAKTYLFEFGNCILTTLLRAYGEWLWRPSVRKKRSL